MKKLFSAMLAAVMLVGCSSSGSSSATTAEAETTAGAAAETVTAEGLKILAPQGAPALSLIPVKNDDRNDITTVDGSDALQAAFVSPTSEYDVIIAPTNLGVKLASAGNTNYKLLAIVDWGNLYIVGNDESVLEDENAVITAFGEDAVPGLVFKRVYEDQIAGTVNWVGTVQEAMATLVAGQCDAALLAEPVATAAIAKAKENDLTVSVVSNVQEEWGDDGFPMAGFFVNSETYEENSAMYASMLEEMKEYAETTAADEDKTQLVDDINAAGTDFYGVPSAEIIGKCYNRMNIGITMISECKDEVSDFLSLFGVDSIDDGIISQ